MPPPKTTQPQLQRDTSCPLHLHEIDGEEVFLKGIQFGMWQWGVNLFSNWNPAFWKLTVGQPEISMFSHSSPHHQLHLVLRCSSWWSLEVLRQPTGIVLCQLCHWALCTLQTRRSSSERRGKLFRGKEHFSSSDTFPSKFDCKMWWSQNNKCVHRVRNFGPGYPQTIVGRVPVNNTS